MKFNYYTKRNTGFEYDLWVAYNDEYVTVAKFDNNQYLVSNEARGCEEMFDNLDEAKSKAKYSSEAPNRSQNASKLSKSLGLEHKKGIDKVCAMQANIGCATRYLAKN